MLRGALGDRQLFSRHFTGKIRLSSKSALQGTEPKRR